MRINANLVAEAMGDAAYRLTPTKMGNSVRTTTFRLEIPLAGDDVTAGGTPYIIFDNDIPIATQRAAQAALSNQLGPKVEDGAR